MTSGRQERTRSPDRERHMPFELTAARLSLDILHHPPLPTAPFFLFVFLYTCSSPPPPPPPTSVTSYPHSFHHYYLLLMILEVLRDLAERNSHDQFSRPKFRYLVYEGFSDINSCTRCFLYILCGPFIRGTLVLGNVGHIFLREGVVQP